jgi:gamma-glutamyltranspeptidase/glutathione hydrolase
MRRLFSSLAAALALVGCAAAAPQKPPPFGYGPEPGIGGTGTVSAADPRAAEAGAEMLRAGGSAADAAIATMLALNVVEPQSSGIGGGGYLLYSQRGAVPKTYDGRETAPAAATGTWFYKDGQPMPWPEARPGGKSVGVPGNLAMLALAHKQHGKLPWKALFQPAIRLARDGFNVTPRLHDSLTKNRDIAAMTAEGRALYYQADGSALPVGATVRNPALAAFLQRVAEEGPSAFYRGTNAQAIARAADSSPINPSQLTAAEIAAYRAKERPAVCGHYRGYAICGMGPSSSGGITVFAALKQLERFDLAGLGPHSPVAWHLIAESERLAYADRDKYVGDPDFVQVPVSGLIDPAYIASRSQLISPDKALDSVGAGSPPGAPVACVAAAQPERGTSHFVAVDKWGNVASETSTVESAFGSGLMVNGYFLNNELTDFDFVPVLDGCPVANAVAGGKRPRSSMSPMIVVGRDGGIRIALGAAGGSTIPAQVIKTLVGVLDWNLTAQQAIALPMIFAPGDTVFVESGTYLEQMAPQLRAMGHKVAMQPPGTFKANAIEWSNGDWVGAADPRSEGASVSQ